MEKVNLKPIDDQVIIKPKDPETITGGGVIIPEGSQPEATCGIVVVVGPGMRRLARTHTLGPERWQMECKVGDLVYYPKFGAHKLEFKGEEYVVIKESDLFCIEEKEVIIKKEVIQEVLSETKPLSENE